MGLENGARKAVEKMRRAADAFGGGFFGYDGAAFGGKPAARHTAVFAGRTVSAYGGRVVSAGRNWQHYGKCRRHGRAHAPLFQKKHRNHAKLYFSRQKRNRQTQEIALFQNGPCKQPCCVV